MDHSFRRTREHGPDIPFCRCFLGDFDRVGRRAGLHSARRRSTNSRKAFGDPKVALEGDIFEASHTYRLKGQEQSLNLIEAQGVGDVKGRCYYNSYVADKLAGPWREQAASSERPFAGAINVDWHEPRWSDSICIA